MTDQSKNSGELMGSAADGTQLHAYTTYPPQGPGPWTAIPLWHTGRFAEGGCTSPELEQVQLDLTNAGYWVPSLQYRLDLKKLPNQTSTGQWPQQSDDVKLGLDWVAADPRCNGNIIAGGESAGGTHALTALLGWNGSANVLAAFLFSPATHFGDRTPDPALLQFVRSIESYTGTTDTLRQTAMSPVVFMREDQGPTYFVYSAQDPMPIGQPTQAKIEMDSLGVTNYFFNTVPGNLHAFYNWPAAGNAVIDWLSKLPIVSTH